MRRGFNFPALVEHLFNGPSEETKAKAVKSAATSRRLVFTPGGFLRAERGGRRHKTTLINASSLTQSIHPFTASALIVSLHFTAASR